MKKSPEITLPQARQLLASIDCTQAVGLRDAGLPEMITPHSFRGMGLTDGERRRPRITSSDGSAFRPRLGDEQGSLSDHSTSIRCQRASPTALSRTFARQELVLGSWPK